MVTPISNLFENLEFSTCLASSVGTCSWKKQCL